MVQETYQTKDVSEESTPTGRGFDLPADATHSVCHFRVFLEYWSDGVMKNKKPQNLLIISNSMAFYPGKANEL